MTDIVIIGGGHGGAQLCAALAAAGQGARVHLVCDEPVLPYQRPPLSKSYQKNGAEALQWHRDEAWFADQRITVHRGERAVAIDRAARSVTLASTKVLGYEWLVLATGGRARALPSLPTGLANVHVLRSAADAERLRSAWPDIVQLTVLGGGFIGLEVAATARGLGKSVQVLESAPRLMARSVSPELSAHVLATHRAAGIDVRIGIAVGEFDIQGDRLATLAAADDDLAIDTLLLGVGAEPEHALATACGLEVRNGIVVDAQMRTSDPAILAIGDCTDFPEPTSGRRLRLESVQNATDQAKTAAATIQGLDQPHRALPWFWSDQGTMRLQMAGLMPPDGERHRRPGANAASFSILHYATGRLVCVESVNAPMDHLTARKLLEAGISPPPSDACDPARPLKQFLPSSSNPGQTTSG